MLEVKELLHCSKQLESIFRSVFFEHYQVELLGGFAEPVYWPAGFEAQGGVSSTNRLCYREDYFASALHEIAHWCIAGEARRKQLDFGYWYIPDGRTPEQQQAFQSVEVKPQALEWIFSVAANYPFKLSIDNLTSEIDPEAYSQQKSVFAKLVSKELHTLLHQGLNKRSTYFVKALAAHFGVEDPLNLCHYQHVPD